MLQYVINLPGVELLKTRLPLPQPANPNISLDSYLITCQLAETMLEFFSGCSMSMRSLIPFKVRSLRWTGMVYSSQKQQTKPHLTSYNNVRFQFLTDESMLIFQKMKEGFFPYYPQVIEGKRETPLLNFSGISSINFHNFALDTIPQRTETLYRYEICI